MQSDERCTFLSLLFYSFSSMHVLFTSVQCLQWIPVSFICVDVQWSTEWQQEIFDPVVKNLYKLWRNIENLDNVETDIQLTERNYTNYLGWDISKWKCVDINHRDKLSGFNLLIWLRHPSLWCRCCSECNCPFIFLIIPLIYLGNFYAASLENLLNRAYKVKHNENMP